MLALPETGAGRGAGSGPAGSGLTPSREADLPAAAEEWNAVRQPARSLGTGPPTGVKCSPVGALQSIIGPLWRCIAPTHEAALRPEMV